jgi:alkanesulfonate monooxygenase SsuD/methylene tetrahydromethanopterin reductase-like flavin-dependent oxidoreductase (luciferase family)
MSTSPQDTSPQDPSQHERSAPAGIRASGVPSPGRPPAPVQTILTYHVEGERDTPSAAVYEEVAAQVRLADRLGYHAAWFAEHHFHVHRGHLPNPLLLALHLAGQTERIHLGSAVLTTALHHPLRLAEDLLIADVLTGGRLSIGLGSGSTPGEFAAFGLAKEDQEEAARHGRFAEGLDVLEQAWRGEPIAVQGRYVELAAPPLLPRAIRPLADLLWIAANSQEQARVAGRRGYGVMLSRERSSGSMAELVAAYRAGRAEAGLPAERERIAASRPVYVGETDAAAQQDAEAAVALMVDRQRRERPAFADLPPPASFPEACRRVQFLAGSPRTVAEEVRRLHAEVPFTALHVQPRWQWLPAEQVQASIRRLQEEVIPLAFGE